MECHLIYHDEPLKVAKANEKTHIDQVPDFNFFFFFTKMMVIVANNNGRYNNLGHWA